MMIVPDHQLLCPAQPASVTEARRWVRDHVAHQVQDLPPDTLRDLEVVTSEIMTAAVTAGTGDVRVRVHCDGFAVRVDVTDRYGDETEHLEHRPPDVDVDGLDLVHALADDWGWRPTTNGGKTVWALLLVA